MYSRVFPYYPVSRVFPCIPGIPVFPVFRVFPCIPYYRVFPVFRVFPCIPGIPVLSPVFRVFPCIPGYPGYSRYSVYSVYSRVFPGSPVSRVFPCIPVYSRVFPWFPCTARPREAIEPEARFRTARGGRGGVCRQGSTGCLVVMPMYPGGHAPWVHGQHHRHHCTTLPAHPAAPRAVRKRASGLNRPRGERVGGGAGRQAARRFSYLRSFWPGSPEPAQRVLGNRWIGSRSRPPLGGLDVSDLECLGSR